MSKHIAAAEAAVNHQPWLVVSPAAAQRWAAIFKDGARISRGVVWAVIARRAEVRLSC